MPYLTDAELRFIQIYIDKAITALGEMGLKLNVESDMSAWAKLMESAFPEGKINTTYDPRSSLAGPENCFWINMETRNGDIISYACNRVFQTEDFIELVRSNLLFYDRKPILKHIAVNFKVSPDCPTISGRVGHGGAFWVRPDYRGRGFAGFVPHLLRALSLRHFNIDWHTTAVRSTSRRRSMAQNAFGYQTSYITTAGCWPPYGEDLAVDLLYMSRAQVLERIRTDASASFPLAAAA